MKIAIIAPPLIGGGIARAKAYKNFLLSQNHSVTMISVDETPVSRIWYFYQRARAYLLDHEPESRLMGKIADKLESRIKRGSYDAVIGVESPYSYVLTRKLDCVKIFSWECISADEIYFQHCAAENISLDRIRSLRKMELEICNKSDYVIFPWKTTENYVRKHILDGNNFVTINYGCYPKNKTVSYFFPLSIVSMGNLRCYWSNKELLSNLTRISPYIIDVYGKYKPPRKYHLNYKGFAPSTDVLYNYQFGLNTISKDAFHRNHHSSRITNYLAYGLPVLSPDWLQFSHELKGTLPYNENNFADIVEQFSDRDKWEKLSKEAYEQARELDWNIVLQPLERLIRG